jgi:acyl carrier protein
VTRDEIKEKVIEIVCEQMGVMKDKVADETSFINDLGADSLDTVELIMEFEDAFDLSIPDEDAEKIQSVGDAITYVVERSS